MAEPTTGNSITMSRVIDAVKSSRSKRIGKRIGIFLVVFGLLGYFAGPPLLKYVLLKQLGEELQREVSIDDIDINPYALSARVKGVTVKAADGKETAGFDELYVNLSSASIFKVAVVVDEIRLQGLRLSVARVSEGRFDISDLLDKWMKPDDEPDSGTPRFSLNNIQLVGGRIEFDDQPKGEQHTVSDINLALPFVSSLPYQAEVLVEPSFSANVDGSSLELKGRSKPFAGQHESELDLDLEHFDLAGLQPYLPDTLPFRVASGKLDSELKVVFRALSDNVFSLALNGSAHVSDWALAESGGEPLVGWKRLDVDLENADLVNRNISVRRVALDGLDVTLTVNRAGEFNVFKVIDKLASTTAKGAAGASGGTPAKPLVWSLGAFALSNGLVHWRDDSNLVPVAGEVRHLQVEVGKLDSALTAPIEISHASYQLDMGEHVRIGQVSVKGVKVDLPGHRVDVAELASSETRARLVRNKAGKIEWIGMPVIKTIRAADAEVRDEKPWQARLAKLNVDDVSFRFEDQAFRPAAVQTLEGFSLAGENLGNEPGQKGSISVKGKVNEKGSLSVEGNVQATPPAVELKVETVAIPLLPLQPYFSEHLNIALTRGQISNKGEATALFDKDGVKAGYKGTLTLGDLLAVDKVNSADFLKWKSLYLGGIDFKLDPMAINVGEIALTDFYSKLILNSAGRLNLQDIVRKPGSEVVSVAGGDAAGKPANDVTNTAASPPVAATTAQSAATPASAPAKPPLPIKIARITLQNGTVNFSDFFVKPNYTVNVTKLGGRVTGLSSTADTLADMELRGSYANSAPVKIVAKLNPLAAKTYLDLKADVTGVDMVGFSPYSGKYAGYNIEKGKLSLNLAYKLENNQLAADNRLFIDQFTFGEKVDSPDATKLPVNLAIALLKNNRGEIDINLPISGSLDDPQFSVGGLVVRVIVNLFVKAVTSPFALLGSMFGGGEELSNVEFAPGRVAINDAALKKLEALAKALNERDSLKLEITGRADPEADREGVKRVAIERAMKAEKLKDMLKKGGEGVSLESVEIAPDEYKIYLARAYKEAKFPKPRNMIGMQKDLPVEEMEKLMLTNLPASADDIQRLATQRAENVQSWLIETGKVPAARIFLLPPKSEADPKARASRADFSLR